MVDPDSIEELDNSFFDEAIIEIAKGIENINATQKDHPIVIKAETEITNLKHVRANIFRIIKSIKEIEYVSTRGNPLSGKSPVITDSQGLHFLENVEQERSSLKITEIPNECKPVPRIISIEDLFEDPIVNVEISSEIINHFEQIEKKEPEPPRKLLPIKKQP
jgi:hypothetical protein